MIPRFKPRYGWAEWKAAFTFWSRGNIPKYEKTFAEKFKCEHGVMFPHGRTGIFALLKVWELEQAEVICPAYTCVVVPHAIVLSGNIPVFVDCEEGSFNMSLEGISRAVTEKTRVIIPTHLFGYPMDVHTVQGIAEEASRKYGHKIYVVQDCAHSFGAKWRGELVTTYGDATIFGSNISKLINSIFGGIVITGEEALAVKLRVWRERNLIDKDWLKSLMRLFYFVAVGFAFHPVFYGFVHWLERKGLLNRFVKYYDEDVIDFPADWNHAIVEIEARVGMVQLRRYDRIIEDRRILAKRLVEEFGARDDVFMLPFDDGATYSHIVAMVEDRSQWVDLYLSKGEQLGTLIEYSVPSIKTYRKYAKDECEVSYSYKDRTINFSTARE
jgi:dTDP-4-amino-4,6-dideoxygalactose transaminase